MNFSQTCDAAAASIIRQAYGVPAVNATQSNPANDAVTFVSPFNGETLTVMRSTYLAVMADARIAGLA